MKAMRSLIRLHRAELDARRRALVALEVRRAELEAAERQMEAQLVAEQQVAARDFDVRFGYANYARRVIALRGELAARFAALDAEIAAAVAAVGEACQDL